LGLVVGILGITAICCARLKTSVGTIGGSSPDAAVETAGGTGGSSVQGDGGGGIGGGGGFGGVGTDAGTGTMIWVPTLPPEWNCGTNCFADPSVAAAGSPAGKFTGPVDATPVNQPALVYPLPGSMHPINLADITFHWRRGPGASQTLFRIRLGGQSAGAPATYDFYVICKAPAPVSPPPAQEACVYELPPGAWMAVTSQNRGGNLTITISATDGNGGPVATAASRTIAFSPDAVAGGLYYWSARLTGTYRLLFGARKALPFISPQTPANPTTCGGCHAVSRDGNVIAFSAGAVAANAYLRTAPTANPETPFFQPSGTHDSAMLALNPDGSLVLVSYASKLELRNTKDGSVLGTVNPDFLGTERQAYQPDWSPDGKEIAVVLSAVPDAQWSVRTGQIAILPFNNGAFGPAVVVAPSGADFHFYPSWSPDGKWIAFASAPASMNLISYNQVNARLRLVARTGGTMYELGNATQGAGQTSTWPRFAPFVQAGGNIMFLTFNSKIDYGFLLMNSIVPNITVDGLPQLWMSAIDLRRLGTGDPSLPPVWLPFQDVTQRNHLGFWTEQVGCRVQSDGSSVGCGEGEFCQGGHCVTVIF
jgi:hypothetical protein